MGLVFAGFTAPAALHADSIEDFACAGVAVHIFETTKPVGSAYKITEHYCELPNGERQGATKISFRDYTGSVGTTFTFGQYHNGKRRGKWVTTDITGEIIRECVYANGSLVQAASDPDCWQGGWG